MSVVCIVQARTNSTRLPNKINADIGGWTMLKHVMTRAITIGPEVILATPEMYDCPENDVLARYWLASAGYDVIMRITGDCPFIDPAACRRVLHIFGQRRDDLVGTGPSYPDGLGCEVFSKAVLKEAYLKAEKPYDREHVTSYLRNRPREFNLHYLFCPIAGHSNPKLSVDTPSDLEFARQVDAAKPHDYSLEATLGAVDRCQRAFSGRAVEDR